MFTRMNHSRLLRYAGLFTWGMVGVPLLLLSLQAVEGGDEAVGPLSWQGWTAWGVFGVCYAWLTRGLGSRRIVLLDHGVLLLLTASAVAVSYYNESGLGSILLTVVAYLLPWLLPVLVGVAWMVISQIAIVPVFIAMGIPPVEAVMLSLLYAAFSSFIFVTSLVARQQAQAREEQRRLNAELRATRALLAESVRVNERTRISRELHDLLGHHLTALSLNLEVAIHLADGKAQEHVSQAHTLAKLLLSDVREAVSRIRDSDAIDMAATLLPLADNVPGLHIDMRLPTPFLIDDAERAHVLLRCTQEIVTNVVRHAQATTLELHYRWCGDGIQLQARDDGRGADSPVAGNGLRGMRERLAAFGGQVEIDTRPGSGFHLTLLLPVIQAPGRMGLPLELPQVVVPMGQPPVSEAAA
ncbi:MAG: sensor histidine kinase [Lysobacter sp.]|nr:sensor histidine kinase [Lysobacter sp.]